jgi:hypothetical protein
MIEQAARGLHHHIATYFRRGWADPFHRVNLVIGEIYQVLVSAGRVGLVGEKPLTPRNAEDLCELCAQLPEGVVNDRRPPFWRLEREPVWHASLRHKGLTRAMAIERVHTLLVCLGIRSGTQAPTVRGAIQRYEKLCRQMAASPD